ncbi:hypothetical protein QL285_046903 [Trifolium repens]|nr:hypothetical protein QL285_046903 [Trifolium repens]
MLSEICPDKGWSWRHRRRRSPVFYALTHDNADSDPEHDLALDDQPAHDDQPRYRYIRTKWSTEDKQSLKEIAVDHHFNAFYKTIEGCCLIELSNRLG